MALALLFTSDAPPTEFRIFSVGMNTTRNGDYLFDEKAAADVMAAYQAHGVDCMIDLEHLSLDEECRAYDPDARGWCRLELRNGELWAASVTWTPDGDARLREKRQRFISPVFAFSKDTRRISRVLNIAITALPATDHIAPLVAANQLIGEGASPMTPEQFAKIAEALDLGADANVEDVIATIAAMVKKINDAANGDGDAEDMAEPPEGTPAAVAAAAPPVLAAARVVVASRTLARLSGKKDISAAVTEIEAWKASHLSLEASTAALSQERATLEGNERRRLVGEMVKLGAETPATAWQNDDGKTPAAPWDTMPIAKLRDRVTALAKAKGAPKLTTVRGVPAPDEANGQIVNVKGEAVQLSAHEVEACKDAGAKLEDYAANKLIRTRAQAAKSA